MGPRGDPRQPVPRSEDGQEEYLAALAETRAAFEATGFDDAAVEDTGAQCLAADEVTMEKGEKAALPPPASETDERKFDEVQAQAATPRRFRRAQLDFDPQS
jgi:hypothetical protein